MLLTFIQCSGDSNSNENSISNEEANNFDKVTSENLLELRSSFYKSTNFLTQINNYDNKIQEQVSNTIFENTDNLEFAKVGDNESIFNHFSNNFKYSTTYLTEIFHRNTKYQHYEYGGLDQFEYNRVKNRHMKNSKMEQPTIDPQKLRFYHELVLTPQKIGDFNFSENYYSLDINELSLNQFVELGECENNEPTPRGFKSGTGLRVNINIPKSLRLYIRNLNIAEQFSKTDKNVTINFVLNPTTIQESGEFIDIEASNLPFELFRDQLRRELTFENREHEYNALTSEDLSKAWNLYLDTKFPVTADPVEYGISRTAFKRIFLYNIVGEISSISVETEELGNVMWKSNEWFLHRSAKEFANLVAADSIYKNISVLLDSAKAVEGNSPDAVLYFLKKVQNSLIRLKEEYSNTAFYEAINEGAEIGGNYTEYAFRKYLIRIERAAGIETSAYAVSMEIIKAFTTESQDLYKSMDVGNEIIQTLLIKDLVEDVPTVAQYFGIVPEQALFEYYCYRGASKEAHSIYDGELTQNWSRMLLLESYLIQGDTYNANIVEHQLTDFQHYSASDDESVLVREILELYDKYNYDEELRRTIPLAKKALYGEYSSKNDINRNKYNNSTMTAPKNFRNRYEESKYNEEVAYIGGLQLRDNPTQAISYLNKCVSVTHSQDKLKDKRYYMRSLIPKLVELEEFDLVNNLDSKYPIKDFQGKLSHQEQMIAMFEAVGIDMSDLSRSMASIFPDDKDLKDQDYTVGEMLVESGIDTAAMGESIFKLEKRGLRESDLLIAEHYLRKSEIERAIEYIAKVTDESDECEVIRLVATLSASLIDVENTYDLIQNPCIDNIEHDEGRIIATLIQNVIYADSINLFHNVVEKYKQYPQIQRKAHLFNPDSIASRVMSSYNPTEELRSQVGKLIRGQRIDLALTLIDTLHYVVDDKLRSAIISELCEKGNFDLALDILINVEDNENDDRIRNTIIRKLCEKDLLDYAMGILVSVEDRAEQLKGLVEIGSTQEAAQLQLSSKSREMLKNLYARFYD